MSDTPKTGAKTGVDPAAIDASLSVLGEEGGEPKVASIDGTARPAPSATHSSGEESGRQENLEAPIEETEGMAGTHDRDSIERPGRDSDPV